MHSPRELTATLSANGIVLEYHLGLADGITLLCRCEGERDYITIAEDQPGPVVDARPKRDPLRPETRHYIALLRYCTQDNTLITNYATITLP